LLSPITLLLAKKEISWAPYNVQKSGIKYWSFVWINSDGILVPDNEELTSGESKYAIFQALSHPARVKILELVESNQQTFSSLKHDLGLKSSGQLQHHLQKLSGFIVEEKNGSYGLTDLGKKALAIYWDSEKSGRTLEDLCCIPGFSGAAHDGQVGDTGKSLRLVIGSVLLVLTGIILVYSIVSGPAAVVWHPTSSSSVSFGGWWLAGVVTLGFFGVSFIISAYSGYPGCEVTAIPNLFAKKKMYCSCIIAPFNLPDGRLLKNDEGSSTK
jgi:DNA-binding transcriptional ArsR family regulator